jgi:hypothetical protein
MHIDWSLVCSIALGIVLAQIINTIIVKVFK